MHLRQLLRVPRRCSRRSLVSFMGLLTGLLAIIFWGAPAATGWPWKRANAPLTAEQASQLLTATGHRADALLARPDLSAYRGWLKFLRWQTEREGRPTQGTNDLLRPNLTRFADWVRRIEADPNALGKLRGVQEWAYESPVDDSGQPFRLNIPTDYNPARPPGLVIFLHSATGDHLSAWMQPHRGMFQLAVLGRARRAGYEGLAEADVLQALDYVQRHWRIDTNRIHLNGVSMGAFGVGLLGADYPHLFASGQIECGGVVSRPVNNLLTLPIYALHSQDDPLAPIILSRGPLGHLRQLGGPVIFDETDGFGHDLSKYTAGGRHAGEWRERQVRPDSRTVRRLDFTALSGRAARAWWAEVLEWGPALRPAHFALTAGAQNELHAELANITRLRLRLGESPFDARQPLRVSVDGAAPFEVPPPLPESLVLVSGPQGWSAENQPTLPAYRLHTPGGPLLLYDGTPVLIVYGTRGESNLCEVMRLGAEAASKSPNPNWAYDGGPAGSDGIPHTQSLYGRLPMKADREVTDADLQKYHLVLIGTEAQNSLVARLAPQLPVRWTGGKIACSDGLTLETTNRALSLVYYNPFAPQKLLCWVASEVAAGYTAPPNASFSGSFLTGADLVVNQSAGQTVVVTRSFDSRWNWEPGRATSPLLPAALIRQRDPGLALARTLQRGTHADFLFYAASTNNATQVVAGTTRLADILPYYYYQPLVFIELTGTELLAAEQRRQVEAKDGSPAPLYPAFEPGKIEPGRRYRFACYLSQTVLLWKTWKFTTPAFQLTDLQMADVLERFLLVDQP